VYRENVANQEGSDKRQCGLYPWRETASALLGALAMHVGTDPACSDGKGKLVVSEK